MTISELINLWFPAVKKTYGRVDHENCNKLSRIIPTNDFDRWNINYNDGKEDMPLSDTTRSTLEALAGPHGLTIYKALKAKYNITSDVENGIDEN